MEKINENCKKRRMVDITNNPLNIRYNPNNKWLGQTSSHKGFCVFKNIDYGYRAAFILLDNYLKKGYDTIEAIVRRFAPPSENDTENYIKFVEHETIIDRKTKILRNTEYDYWTLIIIICAMARIETGLRPQPQDINVSLAKYL